MLIVTPYGGTYYKAGFSIVCTKPIHINWGDGSSSKISSIGNIVETHTYKKDTGHIAKKPYNLSEENEYCEQWIVTITFQADGDNDDRARAGDLGNGRRAEDRREKLSQQNKRALKHEYERC